MKSTFNENNYDVMELLLSYGADENMRDKDGQSFEDYEENREKEMFEYLEEDDGYDDEDGEFELADDDAEYGLAGEDEDFTGDGEDFADDSEEFTGDYDEILRSEEEQ